MAQKSRRLCRCSTTARPRRAGRREAARSEQRKHVVHVHHVGAAARARGLGDIVLVAASAAQQRRAPRRARPASAERRSSSACATPARRRAPQLQLDRALLARPGPVAVVDDEDAHAAGLRYPADGRARRYGRGPHARPCGVSRGDARLAAPPAHAGPPHEFLVVDDGATDAPREVAARHGARCVGHGEPRSLNAARNTGVREARAASSRSWTTTCSCRPGWLDALVEGAARTSRRRGLRRADPRRASRAARRAAAGARSRRSRRSTSGTEDVEAEMVWGANFAVRRSAFERIGQFDETRDRLHGDEEDWLLAPARGRRADRVPRRRRARPPPRRADDSTPEARSPARRSSAAARRARATSAAAPRPGSARELRVLVGCGWHTLRRACPQGIVMGATLRRPRGGDAAAAVTRDAPDPSTFLSGDAGDVTDPWRRFKRTAGELALRGDRQARAAAGAARRGSRARPRRSATCS